MKLAQVKQILREHGFSIEDQTAFFNGHLVESGTSFIEEIGIKETYTNKEIYDWLGY